MNIIAKLVAQAKKPTGIIGSVIATAMNRGHDKLTDWGLAFITIKEDHVILDIGCGGGKTINKMAKIVKRSKVYGIDYSDVSVEFSSKLNRDYIKENMVEIQKASVSSIPFPDNFFDIITAIETYFFWPDVENDMKEVLRVLKSKGTLLILSEAYKTSKNEKSLDKWARIVNTNDFMHYQSREEFNHLFVNTGYRNIEIHENIKHGWICGIGTKP